MSLELSEVVKLPTGYELRFHLPADLARRVRLHYDLRVIGFQPWEVASFPVVISEPTRGGELTFNYSGAPLKNVSYFVGSHLGPTGQRAKSELSHKNRLFQTSRAADGILLPGEGAVVFWSPAAGRIEFADLAEDTRLVIDPPYATAGNVFRRVLYPTRRLFLVRPTFEKLKRAQDRLSVEAPHLRLKVWDAYRPVAVQRQMWDAQGNTPYVADPKVGSIHNRGAAVDVTLVAADGTAVPMPTGYDEFSEDAWPENVLKQETEERRNFELLRRCMTGAGFEVLREEWWHFNDADWMDYPVLDFDPYEQALAGANGPPG